MTRKRPLENRRNPEEFTAKRYKFPKRNIHHLSIRRRRKEPTTAASASKSVKRRAYQPSPQYQPPPSFRNSPSPRSSAASLKSTTPPPPSSSSSSRQYQHPPSFSPPPIPNAAEKTLAGFMADVNYMYQELLQTLNTSKRFFVPHLATHLFEMHSTLLNAERYVNDVQSQLPRNVVHYTLKRLNDIKKSVIDYELNITHQLNCATVPLNSCNEKHIKFCEVKRDLFGRSRCTKKKSYQLLQHQLATNPTLRRQPILCPSLVNIQQCKTMPGCKVTGLLHKKCVAR